MKVLTNVLFVVGVIGAFLFGGSQFLALQHSSKGFAWYLWWAAFLLVNLRLCITPYRTAKPEDKWSMLQPIISYSCWLFVVALDLGALIWFKTGRWGLLDTYISAIVLIGVAITLWIGRKHNLTIQDPMVRGGCGVSFKAVPQFTLAYDMLISQQNALHLVALLAGHLNICLRLAQLVIARLRAANPEDRRKIAGALLSESWNEISWIAVSIVWVKLVFQL